MEHLIISAIGENNPSALNELLLLIAKNECSIEESRMTVMGSDLAMILEISGNWNTIAKIENTLASLKDKLVISIRRSKPFAADEDLLPYLVQIVAVNQSSIIYEIINFFVRLDIYIDDMQSTIYTASLAGTKMISLNLRVGVSADISINDFREQFALLCEELNLDGILAPEKPA